MPTKLTIEGVLKKVQSLKDRFERLEKDVRALKDLLNVHDNWHSTIRKWMGSIVTICDRTGSQEVGTLMWSDRYNLCVSVDPDSRPDTTVKGVRKPRTRIYTKGGINWIEGKEG